MEKYHFTKSEVALNFHMCRACAWLSVFVLYHLTQFSVASLDASGENLIWDWPHLYIDSLHSLPP